MPEQYSSPSEWSIEMKTTYIVDVMGHLQSTNYSMQNIWPVSDSLHKSN